MTSSDVERELTTATATQPRGRKFNLKIERGRGARVPRHADPALDCHSTRCQICKHDQLADIERDFVNWESPTEIIRRYGITTKDSLYNHAHVTGLMDRRNRNVKLALARLVEHAGEIIPNANAIVQAAIAIARINGQGVFIERQERVDLTALWSRMTGEKLRRYAESNWEVMALD